MKNILYISYDGMTDPLGQSQVLPYIIGLSKEYHFHLISFEKPDKYSQYQKVIQQICDENNIVWKPLIYTKQPPVLSTIYDILQLFKLAKRLDDEINFEIIHCRSYISALVGLSFKRKRNKKFIFDMRGFWADERVDGGIWNLKNPIFKLVYNYFKKKEKEYFIESDAIVSLTENGKQEILSWNLAGVTAEKITVIPCCVNIDLFDRNKIDAENTKEIKAELDISDSNFILGYVGSIGTWYMLPEMMDFFKELLKHKSNVKFLFVSGDNPERINDEAKKRDIPLDRIIVTKCLHSEVPSYISLFDWSIFFILPVYSKKASSPTKQGEIMAMGVPVICNAGVGDTDMIVKECKSGIVIKKLDQQNYILSVLAIDDFELDVSKTVSSASEVFGLKQGVEKYLSIYHKSDQKK